MSTLDGRLHRATTFRVISLVLVSWSISCDILPVYFLNPGIFHGEALKLPETAGESPPAVVVFLVLPLLSWVFSAVATLLVEPGTIPEGDRPQVKTALRLRKLIRLLTGLSWRFRVSSFLLIGSACLCSIVTSAVSGGKAIDAGQPTRSSGALLNALAGGATISNDVNYEANDDKNILDLPPSPSMPIPAVAIVSQTPTPTPADVDIPALPPRLSPSPSPTPSSPGKAGAQCPATDPSCSALTLTTVTTIRVDCKHRYHNNTPPLVGMASKDLSSQRREFFVSELNPLVNVSLTSGSTATYANFSTFYHDLQPPTGAADSDGGALYPGEFSAVLGAFVNSRSPGTINVVECALYFRGAPQKGSPLPVSRTDSDHVPAAGSISTKPSRRQTAANRLLYGRGEPGKYRFSFTAVRSFDVAKGGCNSPVGAALLAGNATAETLANKLGSLLLETAKLMALPPPFNSSLEAATLPVDGGGAATTTTEVVVEVIGIYVPAPSYLPFIFPVLGAILLAGRYAADGRPPVPWGSKEVVADLEAKGCAVESEAKNPVDPATLV